jgi:hypothetical protein
MEKSSEKVKYNETNDFDNDKIYKYNESNKNSINNNIKSNENERLNNKIKLKEKNNINKLDISKNNKYSDKILNTSD